jgi:tRNA(His) guanylyltransferase
MKKDSLGDRMKSNYEDRYKIKLSRRTPVIIRLDGKAFHTLTRNYVKPFDADFQELMQNTALYVCSNIQGAKCAYTQSDEISILLTDFDKLTTDAWFDYSLQKVTSVSAALASAYFTKNLNEDKIAVFDSRAFNIPKEEVCNYFVWRQKDWIRNSITMLAQSYYSHKELHKKNSSDMHEMIFQKGDNWADLAPQWKNGMLTVKDEQGDWDLRPDVIFIQDRDMIDQFMDPAQE